MSDKLADLAIQLSADLAKFQSDLGRANRLAKKSARKMKKDFMVAMKGIVTSTTGAAAAAVALTKRFGQTADQIGKLSQRLGTSTEFLSQMRHTTEKTGVKFNTFTTAIQRMIRRLSEVAHTGKGEAAPALEALGISIDSIKKLSPEEQFYKLADAMKNIPEQGERVRIAMKLFDTEGVALVQTMQEGSKVIKDYNQEAHNLGRTISSETAAAAAQFNDNLTDLNARIAGMGESIGRQLIPAVNEIISQFNDPSLNEADENWQGLQTTLATVYGSVLVIQAGFETLGKAVGFVAVKAGQAFKFIAADMQAFSARLERGAKEIAGFFSDDARREAQALALQIDDLDKKAAKLYQDLSGANLDVSIIDDVKVIFAEVFENIDKIKGASDKTGKSLKDKLKPGADSAKKSFIELNNESEKLAKELQGINSDFENLFDSLLTPLEALNAEYQRDIEVVTRMMELNQGNFALLAQGNESLKRLKKNYEDKRKSIEGALPPYQEYIKSLKDELDTLKLSGDALLEHIARQELASMGIVESAKNQEEFNRKLAETVGLYKQIDAAQGGGQKLNGISNLIGGLDGLANAFKDVGRDFGRGLQNFSSSFNQTINSFAQLSSKFAGSKIFGQLGKIGGIVGAVGQVASFIDQITGGKLFGTDFALESAQTSFFVNQGGSGGQTETTEVRQRSLFRGRQWRTLVSDLESSAQQAIESLFNQVQQVFGATASAVGSNLETIIAGAFEQTYDENGNLTSEISTILGRSFNESFEQFSQRLIAENIIAVLDSVLPQVLRDVSEFVGGFESEFGQVVGGNITTQRMVDEVSHLAEAYRDNATALLDFANFALQAVTDIQQGSALLESLTDTTALIEDLSTAGEKLADTYNRVKGATLLFEESLLMMGESLSLGREEFIRFATEIEEAAGGLDRATGLWNTYFETFYSSQEILAQQLQQAQQIRDDLLSGLGLDSNITNNQFRDLFENVLPTLSAEAIVQWLEAAEAIGLVIDLEGQLTQQRQELTDLIASIQEQMDTENLSAFALEMRRIGNEFSQNMAIARRLGATEEQLAIIRAHANRQIQLAIQQLEQDIESLYNSLFGSAIDNQISALEQQLLSIQDQITLLEQQQQAAQAAAQAAIQAYNAQQAALERVADFAQSLLVSSFSPLNPLEQFNVAYQQFFDAFEAAQGGDVGALNSLQGLAQSLLQLSQNVYASSGTNTNVFYSVLDALNSLGLGGNVIDPNVDSSVPPELQALYDQQIALQEQIALAQQQLNQESQQQQAQALLDMLAELAEYQTTSIAELAERLGYPLDQLAAILNIELSTLNEVLGNVLPTFTPGNGNGFGTPGDNDFVLPDFGTPNDDASIGTLNNSIVDEANQTQEILGNLLNSFDELAAELRNSSAGNSA